MRLLVGLGNPGEEYEGTRHNVGFDVLDCLARQAGVRFEKRFHGLVASSRLAGADCVLLKPLTYMNRSGQAVGAAAEHLGAAAEDIIVLHDDVDLPFGRLRVKVGGGHAGHNGLRSIVATLGSPDFTRVRVGVGRPQDGSLIDHVLSAWSEEEAALLDDLGNRAAEAVLHILRDGVIAAMNCVNGARPGGLPHDVRVRQSRNDG